MNELGDIQKLRDVLNVDNIAVDKVIEYQELILVVSRRKTNTVTDIHNRIFTTTSGLPDIIFKTDYIHGLKSSYLGNFLKKAKLYHDKNNSDYVEIRNSHSLKELIELGILIRAEMDKGSSGKHYHHLLSGVRYAEGLRVLFDNIQQESQGKKYHRKITF